MVTVVPASPAVGVYVNNPVVASSIITPAAVPVPKSVNEIPPPARKSSFVNTFIEPV